MENYNTPITPTSAVVSPEALSLTIQSLDTHANDLLALSVQVEDAYGDRAALIREKIELDTEIKLREADAVMNITGSGKDAKALVGDKMVALTNDTSRDAYRRKASEDLRHKLAEVEGRIAQIDVNIAKAKDSYNALLELVKSLRAKANLQAAILGAHVC